MKDEALKLALEALDNLLYWDNGKSDYDQAREAIAAIKQALAAPVQEPVAWMDASGDIYKHELWYNWNPPHTPLYTAAPVQPVQEPTIAACIIGSDAVGKKIDGYEAAKVFAAMQKAMGTPQPAPVPLTDDPLQGAVDWLLQADGEYFCTATVQRTLRIGYNRAKRLCDTAKERAAHGITTAAEKGN
jgi:DNA segregation ATPase FtsK/SpoIIIE-like protein